MKVYVSAILMIFGLVSLGFSQSNFSLSDPNILNLLKGNFPADSFDNRLILADAELPATLVNLISIDSLKQHIEAIVSFENRNTINDDPVYPNKGILAARNHILNLLNQWRAEPASTIIPAEFSFDYVMCQRLRHTQALAVIPGTGDLRNELVIIEAHLDSRCEEPCDTSCMAQGADDNASGSALLMEMARVLRFMHLNRTIVLIWCTGEEQGLGGSRAFATFCKQNNIQIKAVFNNDIVGGIECGITSSPPGCPGPALVDSLRLRIFSSGITNSMPKNLARMTRLLVEKNLLPVYPQAPKIDVMYGEDRTGRGGDHIPFREQGYTSIRFTSSYENGDGNPDQPGYEDRQHSTRDILGVDRNGDGKMDSFFVNFNYMRNNTLVNALAACNAASNVLSPFVLQLSTSPGTLIAEILNPLSARQFIFGLRRINSVYYDTLIISDKPIVEMKGLTPTQYYITAAGIDEFNWISMFGQEYNIRVPSRTKDLEESKPVVELLQNQPNPFDELTMIPIMVNQISAIKEALLTINNDEGRFIKNIPLHLKQGVNEVLYDYGWHAYECGTYIYSLYINGKKIGSKKMLLFNY
ncbi:MAG: M28 family peptidase [Saprospiraceae bacterium]|nr:M28 family peptidase [Saprospiraceae bacterium]